MAASCTLHDTAETEVSVQETPRQVLSAGTSGGAKRGPAGRARLDTAKELPAGFPTEREHLLSVRTPVRAKARAISGGRAFSSACLCVVLYDKRVPFLKTAQGPISARSACSMDYKRAHGPHTGPGQPWPRSLATKGPAKPTAGRRWALR